ncbi:hypothetical protein HanIR_Chr13g0623201 [Helianthus annuus]|nr:hypothetical protein HanIR_Chr13g0623201 [Helianthus annuus]
MWAWKLYHVNSSKWSGGQTPHGVTRKPMWGVVCVGREFGNAALVWEWRFKRERRRRNMGHLGL